MGLLQSLTIPALFLFRRHLYYCQDFPILFQRSGVGSAHKKQLIQCLICCAKKSKKVYKIFPHGYTVNRETDSTTLKPKMRQQNFTYLIFIRKIHFLKTQDFLRPRAKRHKTAPEMPILTAFPAFCPPLKHANKFLSLYFFV